MSRCSFWFSETSQSFVAVFSRGIVARYAANAGVAGALIMYGSSSSATSGS